MHNIPESMPTVTRLVPSAQTGKVVGPCVIGAFGWEGPLAPTILKLGRRGLIGFNTYMYINNNIMVLGPIFAVLAVDSAL